jgi:hypothetical protein
MKTGPSHEAKVMRRYYIASKMMRKMPIADYLPHAFAIESKLMHANQNLKFNTTYIY